MVSTDHSFTQTKNDSFRSLPVSVPIPCSSELIIAWKVTHLGASQTIPSSTTRPSNFRPSILIVPTYPCTIHVEVVLQCQVLP